MRKIVLPYELGIDNKNAFIHAAKIARKTRAELIILHAFTFDLDEDFTKVVYERKLRKRWAEIVDEISTLKGEYISNYCQTEDNFNLRIKYMVVFGHIKTEILDFLKKEQIDLLVVTIPFEKTEDVELCGDNLKSLFNVIRTPVLLIPEHHAYTPISRIAYATDLRRLKGAESMLDYVIQFARLFQAKIQFIHISEDGQLSHIEDKETLLRIKILVRRDPEKYVFRTVRGKNMIEEVSRFVKKNQIDLVTVIKQDRNFFERMFHESFTNQISLYSKEPILILHDGVYKDDKNTFQNN
jgi:nucleotide-binding universal stress UspA family protein